MHDLLWLLNNLRRVEALLLPLFPGKWRSTPPTYRLVLPMLARLERHRDNRKWVAPLLETVRRRWYKPYHEAGLSACGLSDVQLLWMRWVSGIAALLVLLGLAPKGVGLSLGVKTGLLLGAAALLLRGALAASFGWGVAAWGLLFQPVVFLCIGMPWAGVALSTMAAVWHVGPAMQQPSRRAADLLYALPVLSSWWIVTRSWLPGLSFWQSGLLLMGLFLAVWLVSWRARRGSLVLLAARLAWPSSLAAIVVVGMLSSRLKRLGVPEAGYWGVWAAVFLLMALVLAALGGRICRFRALSSGPAVIGVFAAYGVSLLWFKPRAALEAVLATEVQLLYQWLWPLWWMAGAGVVVYARKIALLTLQWVQVVSGRWVLPVAGIALAGMAWFLGWYEFVQLGVGRTALLTMMALFAAGIVALAFARAESASREWFFHFLLVFGLCDHYFSQLHSTVLTLEDQSALGTSGFAFVSIWLLWLAFGLAGRDVHRIAREDGPSKVQIVGGFLWMLLAMLWFSYVDPRAGSGPGVSLKGNVSYDMFMGLTMLGIPMAIADVLIRVRGEPRAGIPWLQVAIAGVLPVQLIQGVEHYVAARVDGVPADLLHRAMAQAEPTDAALLELLPACALSPLWAAGWMLGRWLLAMAVATWMVRRTARAGAPRWVRVASVCFVSLAAGAAEQLVMPWPAMPYDWSVILRPWVRRSLIWDLSFLRFYAIYGIAGWLWARLVAEGLFKPATSAPVRSGETSS
jgi:hypothetical protein